MPIRPTLTGPRRSGSVRARLMPFTADHAVVPPPPGQLHARSQVPAAAPGRAVRLTSGRGAHPTLAPRYRMIRHTSSQRSRQADTSRALGRSTARTQ